VALTPSFDAQRALTLAAQTFEIEARALSALAARQGEGFVQAVRAILQCKGRVIVMGMGKSGHVGRKIAATLASTGTPAFFVHPAEASHGDLGMVQPGDVLIAISNSGESEELAALLPALKRLTLTFIAMTGNLDSTLARHADIVLSSQVDQEACPLNLAPTASTTAQMALGDALAVALRDARGFREEDFARSHPGGSLGRKLLMHVGDLMRSGDDVPRVGPQAPFTEVLREMTGKGLGFTAIVDPAQQVLGIFTDGDLRRTLAKHDGVKNLAVGDVMTRNPTTIAPDRLAAEAAQILEQKSLGGRIVVTSADGKLVGVVTFHDLLAAKVV